MKFKQLVTTDEPIQGLTTYVIPTQVKDVVTTEDDVKKVTDSLLKSPKSKLTVTLALSAIGSRYL